MSTTIQRLTAKSFTATLDGLDGQSVSIRVATFLTMNSGFFEAEKREKDIARAERYYANSRPAEYFVEVYTDDGSPRSGLVVYRVPDGYRGTHSSYDLDDFEVVGTLIETRNDAGVIRFYVESDLRTVESIRREREFDGMAKKRVSKGRFGHNVEAYKASLKERDRESHSGMATRGHGIH